MGGFGSGRPSGSGRGKVEACRSIDVNRLHREGCLRAGWMGSWQWTRDGEQVASINLRAEHDRLHLTYRVRIGGGEWEDVAETVRIVRVACRFGGARPYFICPGVVNGIACGRRVAKLHGPGRYFLCRHCYRLAHASQSEGAWDRTLRRANKIRQRLGGDPGMAAPFPAEAEGHVAANLRAPARASLRRRDARRRSLRPSGRATAGADRQRNATAQPQKELLAMTETKPALPAETGGTEITRFNALRHGVLSRYTVLPWEDADEYRTLVAALVAEHAPQGPTEEHLVEELAGVLWRKRRLRLAEAAAHRRGLEDTFRLLSKDREGGAGCTSTTADESADVCRGGSHHVRRTRGRNPRHAGGRGHDTPRPRPARLTPQRPPTRPRWRHCARIRASGGRTC